MKRLLSGLAFAAGVLGSYAAMAGNMWARVDAQYAPSQKLMVFQPKSYSVYTTDEASLKLQLATLSSNPDDAKIIQLPMPDGTMRDFKVWQTPMLPASLAAQFPEIGTYTAEALNNHNVTAKLDVTLYGFHAMVFDGDNTYMVDPYDNYNDGYYMVHYKKDETRRPEQRMSCAYRKHDENGPAGESMDIAQKGLPKLAQRVVNGYQLRTYRLAVGCSHQYAQAATGLGSPTVAQTLAKIVTTVNRVNGVYERELSVTMVLVAAETSIIFPVATGDPYGADDSNPGALLDDNQAQCDALIGNANYDIGHVFSTGGGGLALLGVVCEAGYKAQGVTGSTSPTGDGYDIDYVAHEMGHEFGADHTFNNDNDGACGGNRSGADAYEPGSGSTIMAYAGICDPDDIQPHSDPYFHVRSLSVIHDYITTGGGDVCPVKTSTGNKLVSYAPFTATYSIPYLTPFELLSPTAVDSVADSVVLYAWDQYDLSGAGMRFSAATTTGPIFRSFNPSQSRLRIFPKLSMVLAGTLSDAGTENAQGEKVPTVARDMVFKCTYRAILHNKGTFVFPDDSVRVKAVNTGAGFKVTSQPTSVVYAGHSTQTVTWNVVGTTAAPISAANVTIYMSVDGGNTWLYNVGTFPNTGTASITVPNPATSTTTARFKVKGTGNVFFNVNASNFQVTYNSGFPVSTSVAQVATLSNDVKIFPVPATDMVHISTGGRNNVQAIIINAIGQTVWQGRIDAQADLQVASWAKGAYHARLISEESNDQAVKSFIVE